MSNIDTLDMKPDAPVEFRGEFQPIASNVPQMPVCEHLPMMSRMMDKVCVVKSIAIRKAATTRPRRTTC